MFLQCIWCISCQRNKIIWLLSCMTFIVVNIKSFLAETKLLSGVAWWEGWCFPAMPGSCVGKQVWKKSPIQQMKWLGIDKYHGSYVELRSGSKWENMKAHLLKHRNVVTKRVRPCLSLLLHVSSWHKTAGKLLGVLITAPGNKVYCFATCQTAL